MKVRIVLGSVILGVWALNYTVAIFNPAYQPHIEINAPMLIVAGYFFGAGIKKGIKNGGNGDAGGT